MGVKSSRVKRPTPNTSEVHGLKTDVTQGDEICSTMANNRGSNLCDGNIVGEVRTSTPPSPPSPRTAENHASDVPRDSRRCHRETRSRIQRSKEVRTIRNRDAVTEICIPGSVDDTPWDKVLVELKRKFTLRESECKTLGKAVEETIHQRDLGKKSSSKTKKKKNSIKNFDVVEGCDVYSSSKHTRPPAMHYSGCSATKAQRSQHKMLVQGRSPEPEGLLPGTVVEMDSTRRKRQEAEALRSWMERMRARDMTRNLTRVAT